MTEPPQAAVPAAAGAPLPERIDIPIPDEARMAAEIDDDRHHELFLVRAAVIAALLVALVIAARVVWE